MSRGRVYMHRSDPTLPGGLSLSLEDVDLPRLDSPGRLTGRYSEVRNGGYIAGAGGPQRMASAQPDDHGDFQFRPGRGGARMDRPALSPEARARYIEAAHFAEVNTYFHLDRIAHYIHELLAELPHPVTLPRVVAVVHAHNGCRCGGQVIDGMQRRDRWVPFQGGHYRLPGADHDVIEAAPLSPAGEIHLGSGRRRLATGALALRAGKAYRHNAGHNAGLIYHEYGHHIHRHTADFRANELRTPLLQSNRKVSMDEGTSDYWAAVMLGTPHIWALHRRHDAVCVHRRSLISTRTMADYDRSSDADPHINGTIWGACLWDFRSRLQAAADRGGWLADRIVLQALLLVGRIHKSDRPRTCQVRSRFRTGLRKLLEADQLLTGGLWQQVLLDTFNARGITTRRPSEIRP